jgi:two-component system chemotaxis response regulator CheY
MRSRDEPVKPVDRPLRILVVDNSAAMRRTLKTILTSLNLEVLEATDGWEALALTLEHDVELVITDLEMTPGDGFDLLVNLSLLPAERRPKAIVCSALAGTGVLQNRRELRNAEAVIAKPLRPYELLAAVKGALAQD